MNCRTRAFFQASPTKEYESKCTLLRCICRVSKGSLVLGEPPDPDCGGSPARHQPVSGLGSDAWHERLTAESICGPDGAGLGRSRASVEPARRG
eukprot:699244-Pyramimonas_sp.AAC.2